jgi:transcriptional regulator with XRE-family HTH domain
MLIGDKWRSLREQKILSVGETEKRIGLLRCNMSCVENRHTVSSIETMEKLARASEIPIYRLFMDKELVKQPIIAAEAIQSQRVNSKQNHDLRAFAQCLSRMDDKDRDLLIHGAWKMTNGAKTVVSTRQQISS